MGVIACFIGALLFSAKDLASKFLSLRVDGTTSTFSSFFFALPFYFLALLLAGLLGFESFSLGQNFFILVFLRAITDSAAEWLKMSALAKGEISLLASFLYISPVFVLFLSPFLTNDQMQAQQILGVVIIGLGGLLLIWRPGQQLPRGSMAGILLSLGSAFFFSLNHCLDRLAVQEASPLLCGFSMTLLYALFFLPLIFLSNRISFIRPNLKLFSLRGLLEIASMYCKLFALQFLDAASAVALLRLSLLFSILGGKMFLDEGGFKTRLIAGLLTIRWSGLRIVNG